MLPFPMWPLLSISTSLSRMQISLRTICLFVDGASLQVKSFLLSLNLWLILKALLHKSAPCMR